MQHLPQKESKYTIGMLIVKNSYTPLTYFEGVAAI